MESEMKKDITNAEFYESAVCRKGGYEMFQERAFIKKKNISYFWWMTKKKSVV